jgi:AraC-like DNA-binding protein
LRTSPGTEATAHQVSRSIRTIVHTAQAALRWLDSGPANLLEARLALGRIAEHGERLGDIAGSFGSFLEDGAAHERSFTRSETTPDDFALIGDAVSGHDTSISSQLAASPPRVSNNSQVVTKSADAFPVTCVSETAERRITSIDRYAAWEQIPARSHSGHQERQRARLHSFIELRLEDPDLSVDCIAKGCNMSLRSVHRAFATDPAGSASKYVWMRRVDRCAADLRDPRQAHRPITDICFSWGFNSTSHFSRLFKERLGVTPRDYRVAFKRSDEAKNSTPGLDPSSNSTNESATLTW